VLALAGSALLSACATIVTGTTQTIKVDSTHRAQESSRLKKPRNGKPVYANRPKPAYASTVAIPRKDGAVLLEKAATSRRSSAQSRMAGWVWATSCC